MGGEPWLIRKPFEDDIVHVLNKYKSEILKKTPDCPEIRVSELAKIREGGDGSAGFQKACVVWLRLMNDT